MVDLMKQRLEPFADIIVACSRAHGVDPAVMAGLIWTESAANPWAIRVERGFWRRYYEGIKALFDKKTARGKKWLKYPDLVSASYGLCQIMLPVAMEHGFSPRYPTELLEPVRNIDLGCQIVAKHQRRLGQAGEGLEAVLLRYNGGGNPRYPGKVMAATAMIREHKILEGGAA